MSSAAKKKKLRSQRETRHQMDVILPEGGEAEIAFDPSMLVVNESDNDYTTRLKQAVGLNILMSFLTMEGESVLTHFPTDGTPPSLILLTREYRDHYPSMTPQDWVFLYADRYMPEDELNEDVFTEMNDFLEQEELPTLEEDSWNINYAQWKSKFQSTMQAQVNELADIVDVQNFLQGVDPLMHTQLQPVSERYDFMIEFEQNDLVQAWKRITPNAWVPWIISTHQVEPSLKSVPTTEQNTFFWSNFPSSLSTLPSMVWVFPLWTDVPEDPQTAPMTRESYTLIELNLKKKILRLNVMLKEGMTKEILIQRLSSVFPAMSITMTIPKKLGGEFHIFHADLNDTVLADMICNDSLFSTYVSMDESNEALWNKNKFSFHYKGFSEKKDEITSVTLYQQYTTEKQPWTMSNGQPKTFPSKTPAVLVRMAQGKDLSTVKNFTYVIIRLLKYYMSQRAKRQLEFEQYMGGPLMYNLFSRRTIGPTTESNVKVLLQTAPDLIVKGYARKCQKQKQPIQITDDEVPAWEKKGREIIRIQNKYTFVCPNDANPYPTLMKNTLSNKDTYPCLPCCNNKPMTKTPDCEEANEPVEATRATHMMKISSKTLQHGRTGALPAFAEAILTEQDIKPIRYGIPSSPSSLLHCILWALDEKYQKIKNDVEREAYVAAQRKALTVHGDLMAQELYDIPAEQRLAQLRDVTVPLDPRLYYRALEEVYQISIHVITTGEKEEEDVTLALPRHQLFSARYNYKRHCVIVFMHTRPTLHCELILHRDAQTTIAVFSPEVNEFLLRIWQDMYKTTFLTSDDAGHVHVEENLFTRLRLYQYEKVASYQLIDSFGKLVGLVMKEGMTMFVSERFAPLNLPRWTESRFPVPKTTPDAIRKFMKGPPVEETEDYLQYSIQNIQLSFPLREDFNYLPSPVDVMKHQRDVVGLLLQLINILYLIVYPGEQMKSITPHAFITSYLYISKKTQPFDPSSVLWSSLPPMNTVDEFFTTMRRMAPSFVHPRQSLIRIPDQSFATKLVSHLSHFYQHYSSEERSIPNVLIGSSKSSSTIIELYGNESIQLWYLLHQRTVTTFVSQLTNDVSKWINPFLYRYEGILWIVQNTSTLEQALGISKSWNRHRLNPGNQAEPVSADKYSYLLFSVSPTGFLELKESHGKKKEVANIIQYPSGAYAAMLSE